jgi:hypothetical protein
MNKKRTPTSRTRRTGLAVIAAAAWSVGVWAASKIAGGVLTEFAKQLAHRAPEAWAWLAGVLGLA